MKSLPIGIENFKEMIDHDYYYIDKTDFIKDVWKEKVSLYTRPRRFGKTLNMSMLYYFFSIKEKENAYLFQNKKIMKEQDTIKYLHQYPVIFLTLKGMRNDTFEKQLDMFSKLIVNLIESFPELWKSEKLSDISLKTLKKYHEGTKQEVDLQVALQFLSKCLYQHYERKVILLIDEYDVPLQDAYLNNYYDQMVNFLRNVFSEALKTNDALEKGVLTGCLRIAKESVFTGLNNFRVHSILDEISNQKFGFTQIEMHNLLQDYHVGEYEDEMKHWYDGYQFGGCDIYNPWSTLMYVDKLVNTTNTEPQSFWANTSGNDVVYRYIQKGNNQMKQEFDILSTGGVIEKTIKEELTYRELDDIDNIYSFLLFTGYLKTVKKIDMNTYQMMIPNEEIRYIYTSIFEEWFKNQIQKNKNDFVEALMKKDVEQANVILNKVLFQSISYFDYDEAYYHGFLTGMLQDSGFISSNQESGLGRYDIVVLPSYKKLRGFLFELKVASMEKDTEKVSIQACRQIKEKKYIDGLKEIGYTDILGYGIAFYKKSCVITLCE